MTTDCDRSFTSEDPQYDTSDLGAIIRHLLQRIELLESVQDKHAEKLLEHGFRLKTGR